MGFACRVVCVTPQIAVRPEILCGTFSLSVCSSQTRLVLTPSNKRTEPSSPRQEHYDSSILTSACVQTCNVLCFLSRNRRRARALLKVKSLAEEAVQSSTTTTNATTANALTTTTTVTTAPATQQLSPAAEAAAQAVAVRGAMLTRVLLDIGVPILQQSIADASGHQGGRAHDLKQVDVDRQANVTDAAIQVRLYPFRHPGEIMFLYMLHSFCHPG